MGLELPQSASIQAIPVRMTTDVGADILAGKVVAVVDDDKAVCDSMQVLLEICDIDVRTYLSGSDFLRESPDVACLMVDYHMPGLNGLELISELHNRGMYSPAIVITAIADPTIEQRAAELGIVQVLKKPLAKPVLLAALRKAVR